MELLLIHSWVRKVLRYSGKVELWFNEAVYSKATYSFALLAFLLPRK